MGLEIKKELINDAYQVTPIGEIDIMSSEELKREIKEIIEEKKDYKKKKKVENHIEKKEYKNDSDLENRIEKIENYLNRRRGPIFPKRL